MDRKIFKKLIKYNKYEENTLFLVRINTVISWEERTKTDIFK